MGQNQFSHEYTQYPRQEYDAVTTDKESLSAATDIKSNNNHSLVGWQVVNAHPCVYLA